MGETSPPTAADWAQSAAHDAKQKAYEADRKAQGLEARVRRLEHNLGVAREKITALEAKVAGLGGAS